MNCPLCKTYNADHLAFCQNCGYSFSEENAESFYLQSQDLPQNQGYSWNADWEKNSSSEQSPARKPEQPVPVPFSFKPLYPSQSQKPASPVGTASNPPPHTQASPPQASWHTQAPAQPSQSSGASPQAYRDFSSSQSPQFQKQQHPSWDNYPQVEPQHQKPAWNGQQGTNQALRRGVDKSKSVFTLSFLVVLIIGLLVGVVLLISRPRKPVYEPAYTYPQPSQQAPIQSPLEPAKETPFSVIVHDPTATMVRQNPTQVPAIPTRIPPTPTVFVPTNTPIIPTNTPLPAYASVEVGPSYYLTYNSQLWKPIDSGGLQKLQLKNDEACTFNYDWGHGIDPDRFDVDFYYKTIGNTEFSITRWYYKSNLETVLYGYRANGRYISVEHHNALAISDECMALADEVMQLSEAKNFGP